MKSINTFQYHKQRWKIFLFLFAAFITLASLFFTSFLVKKLAQSERSKAEVWAMTTRSIITMPDVDDDFISFIYEVRDSLSLPAIIVDEKDEVIFWRGLDERKTNIPLQNLSDQEKETLEYDPGYFDHQLSKMKSRHEPILIPLESGGGWRVYYKESQALSLLRVFPYVQLSLIALFLAVAYSVFSAVKKSEENLVWVGMAKEAAHQLGTPLSSLMGWLELIRMKFDAPEDETLNEMERDIKRLEIVADRFSKIGSSPHLSSHQVYPVVEEFVQYFRIRTSDKITIELKGDKHVEAMLNVQLFDWIIENLLKNAVNAIANEGEIVVNIMENIAKEEIIIDISDTGKGIPKSNYERIFEPGFTTRKRGWGLGLSLTKRMIDYHKGQILVKESEVGIGTTIRIILKSNLKYEPTKIG